MALIAFVLFARASRLSLRPEIHFLAGEFCHDHGKPARQFHSRDWTGSPGQDLGLDQLNRARGSPKPGQEHPDRRAERATPRRRQEEAPLGRVPLIMLPRR